MDEDRLSVCQNLRCVIVIGRVHLVAQVDGRLPIGLQIGAATDPQVGQFTAAGTVGIEHQRQAVGRDDGARFSI